MNMGSLALIVRIFVRMDLDWELGILAERKMGLAGPIF